MFTHTQTADCSSVRFLSLRAQKVARLLEVPLVCGLILILATMSSPPADSNQIRAKLLHRLGIYDGPPKSTSQPMTAAQHRRLRILRGMGVGSTYHPSPPDGSAARPPLDGAKPFQEKLKEYETPVQLKNAPAKKATKIAFQEDVEVVPIPTRYEYSDRIKSRIWSNRHELQENAERNAVEFAAEGWDWQQVKSDEEMYICSATGELVHPVHLQHLLEDSNDQPIQRKGLERGTPVHST